MKNYKRIFKRLTYVVCGHAFFDAIFCTVERECTVCTVATNRNFEVCFQTASLRCLRTRFF